MEATIFVLQGNGKVRAVNFSNGEVRFDVQVWPEQENVLPFVGQLLAVGENDGRLLVLSVTADTPPSIVKLDSNTGEIQGKIDLSPNVSYRSLVIDRSGTSLFAIGNRQDGAVVATILGLDDGLVHSELELRGSDGRQWTVYEAAFDKDSDRLLVSYHGVDVDGLDWFDLTPEFASCPNEDAACIVQHGGFEVQRGQLYVTTGTPEINIVDWSGAVLATLDTRLEGNHLMQFKLSPGNSMLYAVGSCGYQPGFAAVSTKSGETLVRSVDTKICGEQLELIEGTELLAVAKTRRQVPIPGNLLLPDGVLLVNRESGDVVSEIETSGDPLDILVVTPEGCWQERMCAGQED